MEVDGLGKRYGTAEVLRDVSFTVARGELFGLLGTNGAGKTTTVEILQGLRRADAGSATVLGLDPVTSGDRLRRRIGAQLQDAALPDKLRVGEALRLFASLHTSPRPLGELAEEWDLARLWSRPFGALSGGERQRLFVALALVGRPDLVFLDELTQNLDPVGRRHTWEVIRRVRDGGTTVVLVTHDVEEAERLCDRIVVMASGRVVADGTPAAIVDELGGAATVRFTDAEIDVRTLHTLPGVSPRATPRPRGPRRRDRAGVGVRRRPPRRDRSPSDRPARPPALAGGPIRQTHPGPGPPRGRSRRLMNTIAIPSASAAGRRHDGLLRTILRLTAVELRLLMREPGVLVSLIAFPAVTVLVLAGVFGSDPDPDFGGVIPSEHYVVGYVGVVLASLGLVTLPAHLASHRELGVLRRYRAAGLDARAVIGSHIALGAVLGTVASVVVLSIGGIAYGVPMPDDPLRVGAWFVAGLLCFIAIGGALGAVMPSARAATAFGNLLFVPMFLLGGGGPPREVMTGAMQTVSDVMPLSHIVGGLRQSWLGATDDPQALWWPVLVAVIAVFVAVRTMRRNVA